MLSDSARNATLISELIPENCIVQASEIYDINGDFIDDFVVIYQDTNGFQTFMGGDLFNSPIIIEVYFFNRVSKTLENRIHCAELFSSWGTPWDEDIGIEFVSKNEGINLEFWHYGMGSSHETETVIFRYNAESEDFKLSLIDHSSMSRIGDHPITQWFLADFEKKIIEDYNKPKRKINFKAPTLSEWPNGNWKLLGWRGE